MTLTSRQQGIIDNARQIVLQDGVNAFTIQSLARRMKLAQGTLYKHFKSKDQMVVGMIQTAETVAREIVSQTDGLSCSASEKLKQYFLRWHKEYEKDTTLIPILFSKELFKDNKKATRRLGMLLEFLREHVISLIREAQNQGELPIDIHPEHLALIYSSPLVLLADSWFYSSFSFDLHKETTRLLTSLDKIMSCMDSSGNR